MSVVNYSELDYKRPTKPKYFFPTWAVGIGWGMAAFAAVWIPLMILYRFCKMGFSREVSDGLENNVIFKRIINVQTINIDLSLK